MRIDEERHGDVVVLIPSGDMDLTTLPTFETRVAGLREDGVKAILWDLHGVQVLPSAAIGFLMLSVRRMKEAGGFMAIARPSRLVRSTLDTMGVLSVFSVFDDLQHGIDDLQTRLSER